MELPGHYRTAEGAPAAPDPGRYRLERVLADLVATLDAQGHGRVDCLGYSMGGRIALAVALHHPERVRRLVVEGASPGLATPGERAARRESDEDLARLLEVEGMEVFTRRWLEQPLFATQQGLPLEVRRWAFELRLERDARALAAVLRGLGTGSQPSFWDRLHELSAPTLLLTGALDGKFRELAARMVDRLPRGEHRSIPDAGHATHLEAPDAWRRAVDDFLAPQRT